MSTKTKKSRKQFVIIFSSIILVLYLYNRYNISYPKDISEKLSFHIIADKSEYTQAEPVRITTLLSNNTNEPLEIKYHYRLRPLKIKFRYINKDKDDLEISDIIIPGVIGAPHGFGKEFDRRRITIKPNESYVLEEWLINPQFYNTDFGVGNVEFIANLYLKKSYFIMSEYKLDSAQVTVNYTKPHGKDAEAYTIITSKNVFVTSQKKYGLTFMSNDPTPNEGGLNTFLDKYNDTCYAPYVKYSIAFSHGYNAISNFSKTVGSELEDLLSTVPKDFPLLPEIYIYLLQYYYNENDLPKMWELSESISLDKLNIHNPETKENLENWINKISWWPPSTLNEQ